MSRDPQHHSHSSHTFDPVDSANETDPDWQQQRWLWWQTALWWRYLQLYYAFARYCLVREMSFRTNFLARCVTEILWLLLLCFFFELLFRYTHRLGDWSYDQYIIFIGTSFVLNGLANGLFLENCSRLEELIRLGNLDFALTKPIDEQFLLTTQRLDFAELSNVPLGLGLVYYGSFHANVHWSFVGVIHYLVLLVAGLLILYSLMVILAATTVWSVRNTGLYEVWWYVNQFARYPAEIYLGKRSLLGQILYFGLMGVLPVLLAVNVPARYVVQLGEHLSFWIVYLILATAVLLVSSRAFFRFALRSYRSASS